MSLFICHIIFTARQYDLYAAGLHITPARILPVTCNVLPTGVWGVFGGVFGGVLGGVFGGCLEGT